MTIHILKTHDNSNSKIIREHKINYKDNGKNDKKDQDTDKVPEALNICYIFEILILLTHSKDDDRHLTLAIL